MQNQKRGLLICFEGLDHCGKSTQVKKLEEFFIQQNKKVEIIQFPEIGILIDQYLQNNKKLDNTVIHQLFSINRWEYQKYIEKQLASGITIILDRYAYSGVSFTAAKVYFQIQKEFQGYDLEWCKNSDRGLPEPDIILYLEINEEEVAKRGDFGKEIYEKVEFQKKVKQIYEKLIEEQSSNFQRVNANENIEKISSNIIQLINELEKNINGDQVKPIKKLWTNLIQIFI